MAEDPKPDPKPDDYKPPTREEHEALLRSLQNKTEEADRHAKKAAKIEADRKAAEERALAEQGQYKTLAEQREAELKDMEAKLAAFEAKEAKARERAEAKLSEVTKEWTPEEKALYLREALPVEDRLEIAEARNAERKGVSGGKGQVKAPGFAKGAPGGLMHGGFSSDEEWARRDWKGYKESRDKVKQT